MEKSTMSIGSSSNILTEFERKTTKVRYGTGVMNTPSRTVPYKVVSKDGSYIRRNKIPSAPDSHASRSSFYTRKGTDLTCIDMDRNEYGGNPTNEIKRLHHTGQRLVSFSNEDQMKCMNVTVAKYNKRHKHKVGVKVKCRYDYDNRLILFYLTPSVQVSPEESQCDQEEPQCVPP